MVIDSLRMQIQDLISQVSQLNTKLVNSYDRVSDLEDDLHHLSALNTGLLVEKSHVTTELNRLMEKATEEAAQRGQAESARMAIEKDLDDLSASLFGQANAMVAEARFEKHLSERKVEDAERALKSAEEAVQVMQAQMQTMQGEREDAEKRAREMEVAMGKGKWVARREERERAVSLRLFSVHTPYLDYLAFIAHLRVLHPSSPSATPAMSTLLQLPFLVRLMTEDSEPTVRLDLAPSLNWLSGAPSSLPSTRANSPSNPSPPPPSSPRPNHPHTLLQHHHRRHEQHGIMSPALSAAPHLPCRYSL
ncbi:hypothetical protein CPB84DRAFT_1903621 [Gymnopilus junonius]|uniref:GDP/GTP exchange factor Sec2 N-terminal domain-containing protein n=1 Tax=Gymnopilus junonius TaxID=109634 RepID=A0A9P5NSC4_GYMJU|nr:hypothetical protein CPB84DRAFT_1903621 [Gymnopilus junonius]